MKGYDQTPRSSGSSENTRKLLKLRCRPSGVFSCPGAANFPWPSDFSCKKRTGAAAESCPTRARRRRRRSHQESTQRQYGLRQQALRLGWAEEQIVVIDTDLGQSGASAADRVGFQRLVTEVSLGRAGLVLGLEVSRLAPIGLAYGAIGRVVLEPDEQVRQSVKLLFATFQRTGSALAVVREFRRQGWLFPRHQRSGPDHQELMWKQLSYPLVTKILHNPRYAGAFAFGRTTARKSADGQRGAVRSLPVDEWQVLIKDAHPGYLSWEQYEANLAVCERTPPVLPRKAGQAPPGKVRPCCKACFCAAYVGNACILATPPAANTCGPIICVLVRILTVAG